MLSALLLKYIPTVSQFVAAGETHDQALRILTLEHRKSQPQISLLFLNLFAFCFQQPGQAAQNNQEEM